MVKHSLKWMSTALLLFAGLFVEAQIKNPDYQMKADSASSPTTGQAANAPHAEISYAYPVFDESTAEGSWMNAIVKQQLGIDTSSAFEEGIQKRNTAYFGDYANDMKDLNDDKNDASSYSLNYQSAVEIQVGYNEKGFMVLKTMDYAYTGGAHGNFGKMATCYNLENKQKMTLKDILHIDSVSLQHLIETQFRKDHHLKPGDPLKSVLFDNALPPTKNVYFTGKGISFLYNPYEVAPYSEGIIDVLIPYDQLDKYLIKSFRDQMGIR